MLNHLPDRMDAIEQALAAGDAFALCSAAHSLRGSLSNFTVGVSWTLAGELEALARTGKVDGAPELVAALRTQVQAVADELNAWLKGNA